ncbi:MAG: hypothetical protein ACKOFW_15955, partial [Planctomycetaceae bacterium]
FWTNLYLTYADQLHARLASVPLVFVTTSWKISEDFIHLWAIPEPIIYDALQRIPAGQTPNKKSIKIRPETSRILADPKAEDLSGFYRRIDLNPAERASLSRALMADDQTRRDKQSAENPEGEETSLPEDFSSPLVDEFWEGWTAATASFQMSSGSGNRPSSTHEQSIDLLRLAHAVARELLPGRHWHCVALPHPDDKGFSGLALLDDRESVDPLSGLGVVLRPDSDEAGGVLLGLEWHPTGASSTESSTRPSPAELVTPAAGRELVDAGLTLGPSLVSDAESTAIVTSGDTPAETPVVLAHLRASARDLADPETNPRQRWSRCLRFFRGGATAVTVNRLLEQTSWPRCVATKSKTLSSTLQIIRQVLSFSR